MMSLDTARIVDSRYRIHREIGRGSMGAVYLATDRLGGESVALKCVTTPAEQLDFASRWDEGNPHFALAREFKTLSSLRHPHIISVLDYGFDEDRCPYFSMEYLEGAGTILDAAREATKEARAELGIQLLQALVYLHRRRTLHRDLKPANVLATVGAVKVLDFGLSVPVSDLGPSGSTAGTFAYMAPEVLEGEPSTEAADLYAVGIMLYEIFAGHHPFESKGLAALFDQIRNLAPDVSQLDIAAPAAAVIERLLTKSPDDRYHDAAQVIHDFSIALGRSVPAETTAIRESFLYAARFVGREAEVEKFSSLLTKAQQGQGGALLIAGESGVGKSRLLAELRAHALVEGASVQRGQEISEARSPFELWRQPVRRLVLTSAPLDDEATILKTLANDIEALLQQPIPDPPEVTPEAAEQRLLNALEACYARSEQPIVVLLEDLHWSGDESLQLLEHLAARCSKLPILLLGSYRDDERPDLPEQLPSMELLKLPRLASHDITELSESILGSAGRNPAVLELLQRETEGNAFFVVEVVRALAEEAGRLEEIGHAPLPSGVFTGNLMQIIERRLERIPATALPALQLAAVLGRKPDMRVLTALQPQLDFDHWLAVCDDAAVLEVHDGDWHFAHDKLREGLLLSMPEEHRQPLHRQVAEIIERTLPDTPERTAALAHHYQRGGLWSQAARYCQRAGEQATRVFAYHQARTHFSAAIEALERLPLDDDVCRQRIDSLLGLVNVALFADSPEANLERLTEVDELFARLIHDTETSADRLRRARMYHALGRCHYLLSRTAEAIAAWRQVLPLAQEAGNEELQVLPSSVIGRALAVQGHYGKAQPLVTRAIEPLARVGNWPDWIATVGFYGTTLAARGNYAAGLEQAQRALAKAQELENSSSQVAAQVLLIFVLNTGRNLEEMHRQAKATVRLAEETGDQLYGYIALCLTAIAEGRLGNHRAASKALKRAHKLRRALGGRVLLHEFVAASEADLALRAGRPQDAIEHAEKAVEPARAARSILAEATAQKAWGMALAELGRSSAEVDLHLQAAVDLFAAGDNSVEQARTQRAWGRIRRQRGEEEAGDALLAAAKEQLLAAGLEDDLD